MLEPDNDGPPRAWHDPSEAPPALPAIVPADGIDPADVDQDALRVLSRLQRSGHEAYLVGGCVRDLLLGRKPKDFDVATSAHPRDIKRLFRNGRIIGRRFRLVHVVYGSHVVETSTFRSDPGATGGDDGDLLITEDNVYGTAEEDARRRDFTINALFLDPTSWRIHDWTGGLADIEARVLRTIGDPCVRLAEDPVRILRAIKFATRLGFRIAEDTWEAMAELAEDLVRCAPPRVMEEVLRLMRSGTALGAFRMLRACGALSVLFPEVDRFLGTRDDPDPQAHDRADAYWRLLEALDADVHHGRDPETALLLAVLFLRVVEHALAPEGGLDQAEPAAILEATRRILSPSATQARLSRRSLERARRMIANQRRFTQASTKGRRTAPFLVSEEFQPSLDLFRLRSQAWGQGWDVYEGWVERKKRLLEMPDVERDQLLRKKRRRRRRRSSGAPHDDGEP